jgi:alkylation response protein AidB-like acyl-CoA dehydrogenase
MKLSDESTELRDLLDRFLTESVTNEWRREYISTPDKDGGDFRRALSELGLADYLSAKSATEYMEPLAVISFLCGKHLVPTPLVEELLTTSILQKIAPDLNSTAATATGAVSYARCCSLKISGKQRPVVSGDISWTTNCTNADFIVAVAENGGIETAVAIPTNQKGVTICQEKCLDLTTHIHSVKCSKATCTVLAPAVGTLFMNTVACCKANEIAGACGSVLTMTLDYVKTRKQFGKPIGSFQAIQQSLASAHVDWESMKSLASFAAWACDSNREQFEFTTQAAILAASKFGPEICETALQCHGGIGFTWEYDLHLYLRRVRFIASAFEMTTESARALLEAAR